MIFLRWIFCLDKLFLHKMNFIKILNYKKFRTLPLIMGRRGTQKGHNGPTESHRLARVPWLLPSGRFPPKRRLGFYPPSAAQNAALTPAPAPCVYQEVPPPVRRCSRSLTRRLCTRSPVPPASSKAPSPSRHPRGSAGHPCQGDQASCILTWHVHSINKNGPGAVALSDLGDHVVACATKERTETNQHKLFPLFAPALIFSDFWIYPFLLTANQSGNGQMEKMHKFVDLMLLILYRI